MDATTESLPVWLARVRGGQTQDKLAEDIRAVEKWNITRDRYSKYESGSLAIGPTVRKHFLDYWKSKGVEGPQPVKQPEPEPTLATALTALATELEASRLTRETTEERLRSLEAGLALLARRVGVELPERSALQS